MSQQSETTKERSLLPGDVLSYSAGSYGMNPESFRKVGNDDNRIEGLVYAFPYLEETLSGDLPLIVSCYPAATLGGAQGAVFVDTYLRQANFSRAMMLAAKRDMPVIVISQPLPLLEFLVRHTESQHPLPSRLVVALGGYGCPKSAETTLKELAGRGNADIHVLFGYGMAEVAVGCLMGDARNSDGQVVYRPVMPEVEPKIDEDSKLWLEFASGERAGVKFDTGDAASCCDEGLVIKNSNSRLNPELLTEFENWTTDDWLR